MKTDSLHLRSKRVLPITSKGQLKELKIYQSDKMQCISKIGFRSWNWGLGTFTLTLLFILAIAEATLARERQPTTIETITEVTDEFVGEKVIVTGEVDRIVSPNSLLLQEDEGLLEIFDRDNILIVGIEVDANDLAEGQTLQVTGEVREFVRSEWDEDYYLTSDLELLEVLDVEYEKEPIVYADSVQILN